jgi:hypothetical protein
MEIAPIPCFTPDRLKKILPKIPPNSSNPCFTPDPVQKETSKSHQPLFHAGPNTQRDIEIAPTPVSRRTKYRKRHRNCANPCFATDRRQKTHRKRKCISFIMKRMPEIDLSTRLVEFLFRIRIGIRIPYVFFQCVFGDQKHITLDFLWRYVSQETVCQTFLFSVLHGVSVTLYFARFRVGPM